MARLSAGIRVREIEGRQAYKAWLHSAISNARKKRKTSGLAERGKNRRHKYLSNVPTWPPFTTREPITVIFVRRARGTAHASRHPGHALDEGRAAIIVFAYSAVAFVLQVFKSAREIDKALSVNHGMNAIFPIAGRRNTDAALPRSN
jgi:hypothetical protein